MLGFSKVVRNVTERKLAEQSLRDLSGQLLQIQDEERRRFARELHDSTGQLIAAVSMNLQPLEKEANTISPCTVKLVKESLDLVDELSNKVRITRLARSGPNQRTQLNDPQ